MRFSAKLKLFGVKTFLYNRASILCGKVFRTSLQCLQKILYRNFAICAILFRTISVYNRRREWAAIIT